MRFGSSTSRRDKAENKLKAPPSAREIPCIVPLCEAERDEMEKRVKAAAFECVIPESVDAIASALADHGDAARLLAGGQSLVPMMNLRLARSEVLIDINRVTEVQTLREEGGELRIGAGVRQAELLRSALVAEWVPLLRQAACFVGYPATRNRGTVAGSAAHADPAAELPAALLALDAHFIARSQRGERTIAAQEFFVDYFTTALEPDEFLLELRVPLPAPGACTSFLEIARRKHDFPLSGVAVMGQRDRDGICRDLRVALCAASARPTRAPSVEAALQGERLNEATIRAASAAVQADIDPLADVHGSAEYRRELAEVMTRRAIVAAFLAEGEA